MVFRGKPSKACGRCRVRKLRCDLHSGSCGQCVRANVSCGGYRDTQQLRIFNETRSVADKAAKKLSLVHPKPLPLGINFQARECFFGYYVCGQSRCWTFLKQYYHPADSPAHLNMAIEAVSLAYLWHQVFSEVTLAAARERYISALQMTMKAVKSPKEVTKDTTLLATLLLDLFEKITNSVPRQNNSWKSHVDGALALVKFRGLEHFKDPSEFPLLVRLTNHYMISSFASGELVPTDLLAVRDYVSEQLNYPDYTLKMSNMMVEYARLRNEARGEKLSIDECIRRTEELDLQFHTAQLEMPLEWQYSTTLVEQKSDRIYGFSYDTYHHRNICQAWNIIRIGRILLNESLIERYSTLHMDDINLLSIQVAKDKIKILAEEIYACAPQYIDCDTAAQQKLPISAKLDQPSHNDSNKTKHHFHTPHHQADCYSIIFALYAAGKSKDDPDIREWAIKQLQYIGDHFNIRNAGVVAQLLADGSDICAWEVFAMLGSYAFNG